MPHASLSPEDRRWVMEAIRREVKVLLTAQTGIINDATSDTVDQLYPGIGSIFNVPVARTWGVVSRPTIGTTQLVGKVGDHPGARVVLGYLDDSPPEPGLGETILYDAYGHQVVLSFTKLQFGSTSSSNPMALGDIVANALSDIIDQVDFILGHIISGDLATTTTPGNVVAPWPATAALATTQKATLATQKIKYVTNPLTNVESQKAFTER